MTVYSSDKQCAHGPVEEACAGGGAHPSPAPSLTVAACALIPHAQAARLLLPTQRQSQRCVTHTHTPSPLIVPKPPPFPGGRAPVRRRQFIRCFDPGKLMAHGWRATQCTEQSDEGLSGISSLSACVRVLVRTTPHDLLGAGVEALGRPTPRRTHLPRQSRGR